MKGPLNQSDIFSCQCALADAATEADVDTDDDDDAEADRLLLKIVLSDCFHAAQTSHSDQKSYSGAAGDLGRTMKKLKS